MNLKYPERSGFRWVIRGIMDFKFDISQFTRDANRVAAEMSSVVAAASVRALNKAATRGLKDNLDKIKERTGQTLGDIRKEIHVTRATRASPVVVWTFRGYRYSVPKPTAVMRKGPPTKSRGYKQVPKRMMGVRFRDTNGQRVTLTERMGDGSKPFLIRGRNSGRPTAVYRQRGFNRLVTTIQASSRQWVVKNISFPATRRAIRKDYEEEFKAQLKRSKYFRR